MLASQRATALADAQREAARKALEEGPEEPEFATPELQAKYREIAALTARNDRRVQALAGLTGGKGGFTHASMIDLKLACLVDMLFPSGTAKGQGLRLDLDQRIQEKLSQVISDNEKNIREQLLAAGAQLPPEMLAQMAAEQGLHMPAAERERREKLARLHEQTAREQRAGG